MPLVTSRPSMTHKLETVPWPLALTSTPSSVLKLSALLPGVPPLVPGPDATPNPETPGASVESDSRLRPSSGTEESSWVATVCWSRVSVVLNIGDSVVTTTDVVAAPTVSANGTLRSWSVVTVTVLCAVSKPAAATEIWYGPGATL